MYQCVDYHSRKSLGTITVKAEQGEEHYFGEDLYSYAFTSNDIIYFELKKRNKLNPTIENNFSYHSPKNDQPAKYVGIREKAKEFAYLIEDAVPNSREKSLAKTNLEQAVFWANAAISRNE